MFEKHDTWPWARMINFSGNQCQVIQASCGVCLKGRRHRGRGFYPLEIECAGANAPLSLLTPEPEQVICTRYSSTLSAPGSFLHHLHPVLFSGGNGTALQVYINIFKHLFLNFSLRERSPLPLFRH